MSDWSPPDSDFDTNMGEGIVLGGGRVSPGTQAARDRAAGALRATFEDNSGLGDTVDAQVAKVAGRKTFAPPAQDFAFTPPQSDFQAPGEKSETGPSLIDQFLAPWKGETVGSLVKQNAFVRLADYGTKILDKQREIAAEHPDMGPLEIASLARQQYKDEFGHAPELDINWSELPHQIYQQITDQPAAFVSNLFKSLVVDPEMLLLGTTGIPAKLAQAGSKVGAATVRAGEVGAQMGAQSAGISAAEQLQKTGEVAAQPAAQAAAQGAGMGLALGALHSAVSVGLRAIGKEKSAPVTAEVEQEFAKRFDADVQDGMPASVAMAKNMRDAGMDPKEADAMGAAVSRADRAMDEVLRSMEPEQAVPTNLTKREFREGAPAELMSTTDAMHAAVEKVGADEFQRIVEEQLKQFPADEKMSAADKAWLTAIKVENVARNTVDERRADAATRARVDEMSPADRAMDEVLRSMEPVEPDQMKEKIADSPDGWVARDSFSTARNLLHRDAEGKWRITAIDELDQPLHHVEYDTLKGAVDDFVEQANPATYQKMGERRVDTAERARVDEMSPAEMRKALFTDDLTGLPNRRAYAEADKLPITASIDVDGLKWINDNLGHEAGDQLIRQVADALKDHDAYHLSGDEFVAQFPDRDSARAAMAAFQDTLAKSKFEFETPKGERIIIDGPGATHGIGDTVSASDAALRERKVSKELSGERAARGEAPPGLQRIEPEAVSATGERAPPGDEVQAPAFNLADIKPEIGWAETGGRMIRDPVTGEVTGRTKWIPRSDFWQERPVKLSERDAHAAIDKAEAGKKLTPNEQKFVDYARETLGKRYDEMPEAAREAHEERLAIQQYGKADPYFLALLALPGVGAAAGYWLGGNQRDKVRNALIGGGLGAATLLLGKVRGAAQRVVNAIADKRYNPTNLFEQVQGDKAVGRLAGYQFAEALKGMVPKSTRRSAMTYELEADNRAALTPNERVALQTYETHMRAVRDAAVRAGVEMGAVLDNYATHAYVRGANTRDGLLDNLLNIMKQQGGSGGMSPNSRWAKQRIIPTLKDAEAHGLIPVTTDIAEIARMYTDSVTRTVSNKHFLDALAKHSTPAGEPLLARAADLEKEIKRRTNAQLGVKDPEQLDMLPAARQLQADIAAIKSPRDYVFINHPQLRDFKVHRDIAPPLQALMDATEPLAIEKAVHGVAVAAKSIIFSGSLFHAKSLVDAAAGTGFGAFKLGALKSIRDPNNAMVGLAVRSGLNIIDRPMEAEIAPMRNALRLIEAKTPFPISAPVKGLRFAQDGMNHFLWGVVHPTLKWNVWSSVFERATNPGSFQKLWNQFGRKLGMAPNWDGMAPHDIAKLASTFTNSIFGGVNWFDIANNVNSKYLRDLSLAFASPRGRRLQQIVMLAPDWTVATAQSFYKAFPGMSEPQVGALHRQYLLRQAIIYLTAYDAINMAMSGHHIWQNQDPTMIDAGDGRRIQMAKHTMEPIHWLTQPAQQAWNKLGYPIKEPALQMLGKDWISLKGPDVGGPPMTNRLTHAMKGMLPIPATTAAEQGAGPALSGFIGIPMYGKTEQQAIDAAVQKALGVYKQKQEDGTKQRYRSEGQAESAAAKRVQRQYQKRRAEQEKRESP